MKRKDDDITELFRSRLENATLTPRNNFWSEIRNDIPAMPRRKHLYLYRTAAAASVALIISAASATFLYFSSKNVDDKSIVAKSGAPISHKMIRDNHISVNSDQLHSTSFIAKAEMKNTNEKKTLKVLPNNTSTNKKTIAQTKTENNDSTVTVTVRMRVRVQENYADNSNSNNNNNGYWQAGGLGNQSTTNNSNSTNYLTSNNTSNKNSWAIKAALNIAAPAKGRFSTPLGGSLTVEKQLNEWLALESGVQYTNMHSDEQTLQYLGIPLKANAIIAKSKDIVLYATVGGSADKCISATHGSADEAVQFSTLAGLGLKLRLNKNLSLYAEPSLVHYFNNSAKYDSYRTEKNNAFNLQGGLCMTF